MLTETRINTIAAILAVPLTAIIGALTVATMAFVV